MNKTSKKKKVFRWNFMIKAILWNSFLEYYYLWLLWSRVIFLFLNIISFNNAMFLILTCYSYFLLFLAIQHSLWDLSSPNRDWTQALGTDSTESWLLDYQGIPKDCFFFLSFFLKEHSLIWLHVIHEKWNIACHVNKKRMSQSPAIAATDDSELVSPEGT